MKKRDFKALTSGVTNVYKSVLGYNWSCLERDYRNILGEAIWDSWREARQGLIGCVCMRWEAEISEYWLAKQWPVLWAGSLVHHAEESQSSFPLPSYVLFWKSQSSLFSPIAHTLLVLDLGCVWMKLGLDLNNAEPISLFSMGTIYGLETGSKIGKCVLRRTICCGTVGSVHKDLSTSTNW